MQLTNEWISGFVDGEGSFNIQKIKRTTGIPGIQRITAAYPLRGKESTVLFPLQQPLVIEDEKPFKEVLNSSIRNTKRKDKSSLHVSFREKIVPSCVSQGKGHIQGEKTILRHRFIVSQDKRSGGVLYGLKRKFKCGTVHKAGGNMMAFQVSKNLHLEKIIIPFFQKYTLKTTKGESFRLFVESMEKYNKGKTRERDSISSVTLLSEEKVLKSSIRDTRSEEITAVISSQGKEKSSSFSDNWLCGFIDAEGCFSVSLVKDYPRPQLLIGLQSKEKEMLVELQKFLKCGTLRTRKDGVSILQVASSRDLERYIFPKLQRKGGAVLLQTSKRISYQKFRKIVRLISEKKHHTIEGLEKIKKYKTTLNKENNHLSITKTEKGDPYNDI